MNSLRLSLVTLVTANHLMALDATAETATWPQWRGPNRDGLIGGPAWPEKLDTNHLREVWRVALGPSYSGPIVGTDRVFTTETKDKKFEIVTAFDRATGKELWRTQWEGAISVPFFAKSNGDWVRSTPALDGDRLYVAITGLFFCRPICTSSSSVTSRVKPMIRKLLQCTLSSRAGLLGHRVLIVPRVGPVGGPDLNEQRAAAGHDLGDPERAADLHQLPTGYDNLPARGQGFQDQENRGRIIVDHQGCLGPGLFAQQLFHKAVAAAPLPRRQVEFEVRVVRSCLAYAVHRAIRQDRSAQVGMDDDPGGVDEPAQTGALLLADPLGKERQKRLQGKLWRRDCFPAEDSCPQFRQDVADTVLDQEQRSLRCFVQAGNGLQAPLNIGNFSQEFLACPAWRLGVLAHGLGIIEGNQRYLYKCINNVTGSLPVNRFSEAAQAAAEAAGKEVRSRHHKQIEVEHVLWALMQQADGVAQHVLQQLGIDLQPVVQQLDQALAELPEDSTFEHSPQRMPIAPRTALILKRAEELANLLPDLQIDTAHIRQAICEETDGASAQILQSFEVTPERLLWVLLDLRAAHAAAAAQAAHGRAEWELRIEQQLTRIEGDLAAIRSMLNRPGSRETV